MFTRYKNNTKINHTKGFDVFLASVNCGGSHNAPRCELCKLGYKCIDDSNNCWCDGNCYFDEQDNTCRLKGRSNNASKTQPCISILKKLI